eukprot:2309413-Ditylum_brightwellii.AAC.1
MNILGAGTCRKNRKGFPGDVSRLVVPSQSQWGTFKRLYNRLFYLVATRWKNSKTLQFISNLRVTGVLNVQRRIGRSISTHECPEEITYYQDHMDAVDRGDQLHLKRSWLLF